MKYYRPHHGIDNSECLAKWIVQYYQIPKPKVIERNCMHIRVERCKRNHYKNSFDRVLPHWYHKLMTVTIHNRQYLMKVPQPIPNRCHYLQFIIFMIKSNAPNHKFIGSIRFTYQTNDIPDSPWNYLWKI